MSHKSPTATGPTDLPARLRAAPGTGRVTLVGGGPGDPELLTLKAARALGAARLVLYDHLVSAEVLGLLPRDAERIYVGKEAAHHSLAQRDIIALMIRLAREGRSLVRLKGGDPYIFGRGGEEAAALVAAGVPVDVVPGISAAQGASACAGIPLTHRDHADSVVYVSGHAREDGQARAETDWAALARPRQTVVVYMGVGQMEAICATLARHGLPADTPAALVRNATLPDQHTLTGTLATLPALARAQGLRPPALLIIGQVVQLHTQLGSAAQSRSQAPAALAPPPAPLAGLPQCLQPSACR